MKLNIYCCGGAGTNLGAQFTQYSKKQAPGFAEIETYFIDTSKSNMNPSITADNIYLVDDLDGSGKKRDTNYVVLSERAKEILHRFKPGDINIILHSASGGSGSVIGPILTSELLSRGILVLVVMVGSTGSRKETENTLKTLQSYEMISSKREMPLVAFYRENSRDKPRGHVDSEIHTAVVMLAAIFSGANRELDTADLRNFINYNKVTSYSPKLSFLDFFSGEVMLEKGQSLVSLVSLVDDKTTSDISIPVEYQTVGFISDATMKLITIPLPIHACVIAGYFNQAVHKLDEKLKMFDEARSVVVEKSIVKSNTDSTHEGLIL